MTRIDPNLRKPPAEKPKSQKQRRAEHRRQVDPVRQQFKKNVGHCERCGRVVRCACHEIGSGPAKEECEKHPGLWLCLCDASVEFVEEPCHPEVQAWPEAKQMALRIKRDLETLNAIRGRGPNDVTIFDVLGFWNEV
jgi:hypothetical protein